MTNPWPTNALPELSWPNLYWPVVIVTPPTPLLISDESFVQTQVLKSAALLSRLNPKTLHLPDLTYLKYRQ